MAFPLGGDNFNMGWNCKFRQPKSGYTPVVGDLVIVDTTVPFGVDAIAANENPYAIVIAVTADNYPTVAELVAGTQVTLPYTGTVNVGDKIEGSGGGSDTTLIRTIVRSDNSNGVGTVLAVDGDTAYGTGYCTVRFNGAT